MRQSQEYRNPRVTNVKEMVNSINTYDMNHVSNMHLGGSGDQTPFDNDFSRHFTRTDRGIMDEEFHKAMRMYGLEQCDDLNAVNESMMAQTEIVDLVPVANPLNIWASCVAYCATSMARRRDALETITLINGTPAGLYWLSACTLFYTIYEMSIGAIGPIQNVSPEMWRTLLDVAPLNQDEYGFTPRWNLAPQTNILDYINLVLTYNSTLQPLVSLAPHTGAFSPEGWPLVQNIKPILSVDDLYEVGPRAFELVQRYLLESGSGSLTLKNVTERGGFVQSAAMFALALPQNDTIPGTFVVSSEVPLFHDDYPLIAMGWFNSPSGSGRQGWTTKTVRQSSAPWLTYMMNQMSRFNPKPTEFLTHTIDVGIATATDLSYLIAADVMASGATMTDVNTGAYVPTVLSQLTAGEFLYNTFVSLVNRFSISSAMCSADVLPDQFNRVIAGSKFIVTGFANSVTGVLDSSEDLAALSAMCVEGTFHYPCLSTRGTAITVDYDTLGGSSFKFLLDTLYPGNGVLATNFIAPIPGQLPDTIDFNPANNFCLTQGSGVNAAIRKVGEAYSFIAGSENISVGSGSTDGPTSRHLYMTHVLERPPGALPFFNTMYLHNVVSTLSTQKMSMKHAAGLLDRAFAVVVLPEVNIPAYKTLWKRPNAFLIDVRYSNLRAPTITRSAHYLAANAFGPSETIMGMAMRTALGEGGYATDYVKTEKGPWISALEFLAQGLGDFISPQVGKMAKGLVGKAGSFIHKTFIKNKLHYAHAAPVSAGLISHQDYFDAIRSLNISLSQKKKTPVHRNQIQPKKGNLSVKNIPQKEDGKIKRVRKRKR